MFYRGATRLNTQRGEREMNPIRLVLAFGVMMLATNVARADQLGDALKAAQRGDFAVAATLWLPLARQGNVRAQYDMGVMYQHGQGVAQDYKQAAKWYQLAAARGDQDAQNNLGGFYDQGYGVTQDYKQARKWYGLAAASGDIEALNNIGVLYIKGHGVPQDNVHAYMWESLAAAHGNAQAPKNIDLFVRAMKPGQIAQAKAMAAKCEASKYKNCD
jgi:TPR repeat protein